MASNGNFKVVEMGLGIGGGVMCFLSFKLVYIVVDNCYLIKSVRYLLVSTSTHLNDPLPLQRVLTNQEIL